ncbi:hypothetical protein D3C86_2010470 [compost metagenome]
MPVDTGDLGTDMHAEYGIKIGVCGLCNHIQMMFQNALVPGKEVFTVSRVITASCIEGISIARRVNLAFAC